MDITVQVAGFCAGGNHIDLRATVDGTQTFSLRDVTKSDFTDAFKGNERDALLLLIRNFIKESGLTNWAQIKTQLEAHTFKL